MNRLSAAIFSLFMAAPIAAFATPVVSPGGKPGAAASWSASGTTVTLTLASGYDASEVAKAISAGVPGATAKADGAKVVVTGVALEKLLVALEKVEVGSGGVPGAGDDVDAMLANLQKPGGEEDGSGSSVRATKAADFSDVLGAKSELITAKVVEVKRAQFPMVLVTVKVANVPKTVTLAGVKNGAKLTVLPRVKSKNGIVDPKDDASKLNVGAWYAQPGDTVLVRLEPEPKDGVWIAAAFDRHVK